MRLPRPIHPRIIRIGPARPRPHRTLRDIDFGVLESQVGEAGQLWVEAKPRLTKLMRQYDEVSPELDWFADNWPLVLAGVFGASVLTTLLGSALYHRHFK